MQVMKEKINFFKNINSNTNRLFFILGPCVIESEDHVLKMADFLKNLSIKLKFNFVFKASFDKANRTSLKNFRGIGIERGLRILDKVKSEYDLQILTDVHECYQVKKIAQVADVLQIPAFLCRQTDLLLSVGKTGKIVHLKKGQFVAAENIKPAIEKIESTGNKNIWICERGYAFGYNNLIVDYRNFPIMKSFGKPVTFDVTHSVQRPSGQGGVSGGDRKFVPALAISAVAQGISGIFMEVHDNPEKALSDGPNSIRLLELENLIKYLIDLDSWIKSKNVPEVS